eukprot:scaffold332_cov117-Cylindrotheca_fusiformis.AAC.16
MEHGARRRGHVEDGGGNVPTILLKESPGKRTRRFKLERNRIFICGGGGAKRRISFVASLLLLLLLLTGFLSYFTSVRHSESIRPPTPSSTKNNSDKENEETQPLLLPQSLLRKQNSQQEDDKTVPKSYQIPRILIFTHYRDLLHTAKDDLKDEEEQVLAANVHHSIHLHPDSTVRFLTDDDCIQSLQHVFPDLIPYFVQETEGMFKADICRGSALYETGGIYLDVDVGVRTNLWQDLLPSTEFVTSLVHAQSNYPKHFFQAILGSAPQSRILYKYLELFLDHYTGKNVVDRGPLGVILLRRAWDAVYDGETDTPSTELYREVLYQSKFFPNLHPAPTWGTRRACHFVVVARANHEQYAEFEAGSETNKKRQYRIPFYSRIGGSRMCPISQQEQEQQHENNTNIQVQLKLLK